MGARAPASGWSGEQTQERLLVEAAQKDPARFDALYEIYFAQVYAFVARRVSDRDTAEDLTADVFHKALVNIRRFEWRDVPFVAWLLRIALNAIIDRSKRAGREVLVDDPPEAVQVKPADLVESERQAQVFRMVGELPEDQRRVVTMRFAEEKSIREIAQSFGRSEGAIKQLQFRALENLRTRLETQAAPPRSRSGATVGDRKSRKSGGKNG